MECKDEEQVCIVCRERAERVEKELKRLESPCYGIGMAIVLFLATFGAILFMLVIVLLGIFSLAGILGGSF
jgi:hypothetical protein